MAFAVGYKYLEIATYVMLTLVLGIAIYFWGRGIRNVRSSDLIAGLAIFVILCIILFVMSADSGVFSLIGELALVFGIATLLLSALARPGSRFPKSTVIAIGVLFIVVGLCASVII